MFNPFKKDESVSDVLSGFHRTLDRLDAIVVQRAEAAAAKDAQIRELTVAMHDDSEEAGYAKHVAKKLRTLID